MSNSFSTLTFALLFMSMGSGLIWMNRMRQKDLAAIELLHSEKSSLSSMCIKSEAQERKTQLRVSELTTEITWSNDEAVKQISSLGSKVMDLEESLKETTRLLVLHQNANRIMTEQLRAMDTTTYPLFRE